MFNNKVLELDDDTYDTIHFVTDDEETNIDTPDQRFFPERPFSLDTINSISDQLIIHDYFNNNTNNLMTPFQLDNIRKELFTRLTHMLVFKIPFDQLHKIITDPEKFYLVTQLLLPEIWESFITTSRLEKRSKL